MLIIYWPVSYTHLKLRFDFTHFSPMTPEEITKVEEIVNQEIQNGLDVVTNEMTLSLIHI